MKWLTTYQAIRELMNYQGCWMTLTNNIIYVSKKKEKLKNLGVTPEARQIPFALGGYFEWKRITTRALIDTQKKCQDSKPPAKCPFDLKLVR